MIYSQPIFVSKQMFIYIYKNSHRLNTPKKSCNNNWLRDQQKLKNTINALDKGKKQQQNT